MAKRHAPQESLAVGGQAVMEGVMMRNGDRVTIAVRTPDKRIEVKEEQYRSWTKRWKPLGWPLIRGMVILVEIMVIGMRAMIWSSNQALGEEEEFSTWELILTIAFAIVLSLALFKLLPLFLATIFQERTGTGNFSFNLADGLIKVALLVGYIWVIGQMKDVHRLFQYHGSEHKSINCYESRKKLTVRNVLASSRFHPRCGTTFILFVFFISVLFYLLIPLKTGFWAKLGLRILFLPLIAGVSYELIKLGGKHYEKPVVKALLAPGMLLQRLTTREPDAEQAAVAIKSLEAAVKE
ncbi:DUF1385 domain-containing protein [Candidatus Woesearchaeota archaeon]|nr:DUF1385 domain-containing protein [Candidatus Woesearchaeota archaeon]